LRSHDSERQYVRDIVEGLRESKSFLVGDLRKRERELWVANEFLDYLQVDRRSEEVRPSDYEPFDVIFRNARFQVKEILKAPGQDRKRDLEYKEALQKAESATKLSDLVTPYTSPTVLSITETLSILERESLNWQLSYSDLDRSQMDILSYLNLKDTVLSMQQSSIPEIPWLSQQGWRSVSVVSNNCAFVLLVAQSAPPFLREKLSKVLTK
jgi:hypothetical protein